MRRQDSAHLQTILSEAITVLCKASLTYHIKFAVEGLLAVTLDDEDIFVVNIQKTILDEAKEKSNLDEVKITSNSKPQGPGLSSTHPYQTEQDQLVDLSTEKEDFTRQNSHVDQNSPSSHVSEARNGKSAAEKLRSASGENKVAIKNEKTEEDHLYGNTFGLNGHSNLSFNLDESRSDNRKRRSDNRKRKSDPLPSPQSESDHAASFGKLKEANHMSTSQSLSGESLEQNGCTLSDDDEPLDFSSLPSKRRSELKTTSSDSSTGKVGSVEVKKEHDISIYKQNAELLSSSHGHMMDLASQWLSASINPMLFPSLQPDLFTDFKPFQHPDLLLSPFALPDAKLRWTDFPSAAESLATSPISTMGAVSLTSPAVKEAHAQARPQGFVCETCNASFSSHANLENHRWTHDRGAYRCKLCAKSFKSPNYLYQHNKYVHIQGKFYACNLCPKRFVKKQNLRIHMSRHHQGVYPFYENTTDQQGNRVSMQSSYIGQNGELEQASCSQSGSSSNNLSHSMDEAVHIILDENSNNDKSGQPFMSKDTGDFEKQPLTEELTSGDGQQQITETVANNSSAEATNQGGVC